MKYSDDKKVLQDYPVYGACCEIALIKKFSTLTEEEKRIGFSIQPRSTLKRRIWYAILRHYSLQFQTSQSGPPRCLFLVYDDDTEHYKHINRDYIHIMGEQHLPYRPRIYWHYSFENENIGPDTIRDYNLDLVQKYTLPSFGQMQDKEWKLSGGEIYTRVKPRKFGEAR